MREDLSADYKTAKERADEILISPYIKGFPLDWKTFISDISKEVAIAVLPYTWAAEKGFKLEDFIYSEDAQTSEANGRFLIFYNQNKKPERIEFTMFHESGHILLGHDFVLIKKYIETKDPQLKKVYDAYEAEANYFAACLLMPGILLEHLKGYGCIINSEFLQKTFGVSEQAALVRLKTLYKDKQIYSSYEESEQSLNDAILMKFGDFIKANAPRRKTFKEELEYEFEMEKRRNKWLSEGY